MTRRQESELGHHRGDTGFYDHVLPVSEVGEGLMQSGPG